MAASSVLVLVLIVVGLLVLAIALAVPRPDVTAPTVGAATLRAAERHMRRSRLVGLGLGIIVAVVLWQADPLGRGSMLAAVGFGLVFLVATCMGELTSPMSRSVRSDADLRRRRVVDYLPRGLSLLVAAGVLVLVALLVVGLVTGSADDLGRPGRVLAWSTPTGAGTAGPWPGSFYAWPMLGALAVELAVAAVALKVVVGRAQVVATAEGAEVDRVLRAGAVRGVVSATGVATAFPLAGVAVVMTIAAGPVVGDDGAPGWLGPVAWVAGGAALLAVAVLAISAASLLRSSAGRVVRDDPGERAEDVKAGTP